jgi:hypothetical protein
MSSRAGAAGVAIQLDCFVAPLLAMTSTELAISFAQLLHPSGQAARPCGLSFAFFPKVLSVSASSRAH